MPINPYHCDNHFKIFSVSNMSTEKMWRDFLG